MNWGHLLGTVTGSYEERQSALWVQTTGHTADSLWSIPPFCWEFSIPGVGGSLEPVSPLKLTRGWRPRPVLGAPSVQHDDPGFPLGGLCSWAERPKGKAPCPPALGDGQCGLLGG